MMQEQKSLLPGLPGNPYPEEQGEMAAGETTTGEEDNGVTPEEQAEYSEFEENYMRMIYEGDHVRPELLEALEAARDSKESDGTGPSPAVATLANLAVQIVGNIDDAAERAQRPLSDDVLFQGGASVIEELAEVSRTARIHDYTEKEMAGALTLAVDMYRDKAIKSGRTDEQTLTSEWDRLIAADQEGRVDEVAPGISEAGDGNG